MCDVFYILSDVFPGRPWLVGDRRVRLTYICIYIYNACVEKKKQKQIHFEGGVGQRGLDFRHGFALASVRLFGSAGKVGSFY